MVDYIDRKDGTRKVERVYGSAFIELLYGDSDYRRLFAFFLLPLVAKLPIFSKLYALIQKSSWSRKKIGPFIRDFAVDPSEFAKKVEGFTSFNDFFIRKLKDGVRPISTSPAVLPADARYLVFQTISLIDRFFVKGGAFSLEKLLCSSELARRYEQGSMVLARLCPSDYHRFHFPVDCVAVTARSINGSLFSVNPTALKGNRAIFWENRRVITELHSLLFGTVLYIEIGATFVGSIHQTFKPGHSYKKGDEKGFFSFGGSCLILLFEPGRIAFDSDLLSKEGLEVRGLMGQSMGQLY